MFRGMMARRRALIGLGGTTLGWLGLRSLFGQGAVNQETEKHPANADEALQRLLAGNRRFVAGKLRHPHTDAEWRGRLHTGQHPFATILGCSDSRVAPELLF